MKSNDLGNFLGIGSVAGVFATAAVAIAGFFSAPSANAAIITYAPPTIVGTNVTYPNVSESSNTAPLPLYGAPTISGNDLLFRNMNFSATSVSGAPATAFVDGQINLIVQANAGSTLQSFTLSEFGDYNVSATPANLAAVNYVKVYPQALQISVLAINGVALATPLTNNASVVMVLSPSGGDYQTGVDPSVGSWTGLATANLATLFGSTKITQISVSYDNQLLAQSQTGGIGTISKKGVDFDPTVSTVPEPVICSLIAVAGVLALRRRAN